MGTTTCWIDATPSPTAYHRGPRLVLYGLVDESRGLWRSAYRREAIGYPRPPHTGVPTRRWKPPRPETRCEIDTFLDANFVRRPPPPSTPPQAPAGRATRACADQHTMSAPLELPFTPGHTGSLVHFSPRGACTRYLRGAQCEACGDDVCSLNNEQKSDLMITDELQVVPATAAECGCAPSA